MKNKIIFKCPTQNFSCDKLETATNTLEVACKDCEHYDNGVRPTGSMPILEWIKKIPLIGKLLVKLYRRLKGIQSFETSEKYWKERYKKGGNSGAGSYNNLAEFKGEIINDFVIQHNIGKVIEFGCGDGNQLKYLNFKNYLGYDISESAISICKKMYEDDTTKQFRLSEADIKEMADLTLSLDVIYHLIEDKVYHDYMKQLFLSSKKYVIIYSSNFEEQESSSAVAHVKHRKFSKWVEKNASEFENIKHIINKYQYDGNMKKTSHSDFYIFQRSN